MRYLITSPVQLGKVLRGIRRELHLTQVDAAGRADLFPKTISAFEHDPTDAAVGTLFKLLSALNIELTLAGKPTATKPTGDDW